MGQLEDDIRQELHMATVSRPQALHAMSTGETVQGDMSSLIRDVMLPLLMAQGDAVVRLAAEVDDLKRRVADLDGDARTDAQKV